jgi:hypothetical protein
MVNRLKNKEKMEHRITVSLYRDQYLGVAEVAEDLNVSLSDAVREIVTRYLAEGRWKKTIGGVAERAILAGKTNQAALEEVRKKFPDGATTLAAVAWYRAKLRREGADVPTDRQARFGQR